MKKTIYILLLTALISVGTSSCTDWLDLRPEGEMVLDEYWQTESDAQQVMAACYRALIENDCVRRMLIWGELRSDDFTIGLTYSVEMKKIMDQEIESTNSFCSWSSFYAVINYCNTFLKYAPTVIGKDDNFTYAKLHEMEAEVYTIRALAYFYLVRTFQNVPWISTPSIDDTQNYKVTQSSERAVLDSIIGDLNFAAKYANKQFEKNVQTKGRITQNAVHALLADIYLWDQQYDKCIKECDNVLSDENLSLVKAENMYSQVFYRGNSTESIFELQFDDDIQVNQATRYYYGYSGFENGFLSFPAVLVKGQYSPFNYAIGNGATESVDDYRYKDFIVNMPSRGFYSIFKYAGVNRTESASGDVSTYFYRSNTSNWIVYRLSDVILMKAEAVLQRDKEAGMTEAISLVNQTYHRSNPDADTLNIGEYSGLSEVESLVLRERQRELMFEGKRWFDLMRLARRQNDPSPLISYVGKTTSSSKALSKMSTMNALYWPIEKTELEANPLLIQNPFYETTSSSSSN